MTTIVIARYEEDISWTVQLPSDTEFIVVQKGIDLPNTGRESSSYLHYIINQYDALDGLYFFVQGNPFDHAPVPDFTIRKSPHFFGRINMFYPNGGPDAAGINVADFAAEAGIHISGYPAEFFMGAQFLINSELIKSYPKSFYEKILKMHEKYYWAPWIMERLWNWIFHPPEVRLAQS